MKKTLEQMVDTNCITHNSANSFSIASILASIEQRLKNTNDLSLPLDVELDLLNQLTEFELGKFLLKNRGVDGKFIDYVISGDHSKVKDDSLEKWILYSPICKATRERFHIYKEQIQKRLKSDMNIASIPCGLMRILLILNYSKLENICLTGVDIDQESLDLAKLHHATNNSHIATKLELKDAWLLDYQNKFDLVTSNGLNIYEHDDNRVIELYRVFYNSLKAGAHLVTSFVTPYSYWANYCPEDLIKQKALFSDIIQSNWQAYRTEEQTIAQLEQVGFKVEDIIYDSQRMYPTIIAVK